MKKYSRTILVLISCVVFLGSSMVYAGKEIFVENHIQTGVIDIELNEYQKNERGDLEPWEDGAVIMPGKLISKIPRITNVGYDCYVRAKLKFSLKDLENTYFGMDHQWIYGLDGYWYYKESLESGESVDIFQGIQIPDDFSQEHQGKKISLQIDVDAIQTNNFIPDYEKENPWGDVRVETCIQESPYNIQCMVPETPKMFEIQYDGETESLVKNEEDFFVHIPVLFPGDVYTDILYLSNNSTHSKNLFFSTYCQETDLLNRILLRIILDKGTEETLIYEGPLASKELEKRIFLTKLSGGDEQQLIYTIEVPKELDNQYTLLKDSVRWMFAIDDIQDSTKTGDSANFYIPIAAMLMSSAAIVVLVLTKKSEQENERLGL